jgi:hypothetical protein
MQTASPIVKEAKLLARRPLACPGSAESTGKQFFVGIMTPLWFLGCGSRPELIQVCEMFGHNLLQPQL